MIANFYYQRSHGVIELNSDGSISVIIDNEDIKDQILDIVNSGVNCLNSFKNLGIPGRMKVFKNKYSEVDFESVLTVLKNETGIWIQGDNNQIPSDIPWFGREGVVLTHWNGDDSNYWFVIEDIATGFQSFHTHDNKNGLHWFRKSIIESGLVDDWNEFNEIFASIEDIRY